ncbi:RhuM family protein [Thalassolituus sp.]|uniref:RhuM family protein n=1 Tax=Thalassolituus sp. TaxID=2030822 RepID=UPI002A7EF4F1|nr:RhuM family protein [Thalassolituus sp.]
MTDQLPSPPVGEFVMFTSDDGCARVECRFESDTLWLSQAAMADLYQVTPQAITQHIRAIYEDRELDQNSTCKDYLQVQTEGGRKVSRKRLHYSLPMIIAVGYRVRSTRGTQFRQWVTRTLTEYLSKGDIATAKNYITEPEIKELKRIVTMWLDFAEDQAERRQQVFLQYWQIKLDQFLQFNDRDVLTGSGKISKKDADEKASAEYERFAEQRRQLKEQAGEQDIDELLNWIPPKKER